MNGYFQSQINSDKFMIGKQVSGDTDLGALT